MRQHWIGGNRISLLENGEQYFPRMFEAFREARHEILLETFIWFDDKVGRQLHAGLLSAARRGVQIDVTIDGVGSPDFQKEFVARLTDAGVRIHVFNPVPKLFRRMSYFRRMHRKLVVVDGVRAFIGGINYAADHMTDFGAMAKQDYAAEIEGPVVARIHEFMRDALRNGKPAHHRHYCHTPAARANPAPAAAGEADAMFVWRDNHTHRDDIERHYRLAIRLARYRVIIANAYFFPGYSFLRELRKAARRGVQVSLLLQGKPDMPIVQTAAAMLYDHLLSGGVRIYEYVERPLHAKVAVVDDQWATIGSSNLDPLSLSLNLEANVFIRDHGFNQALSACLHRLMADHCRQVQADELHESSMWRKIRSFFLFHILRRYPAWAGRLPAHAPRLEALQPEARSRSTGGMDKTAWPRA